MALVRKIDEAKTKCNARELLKNYRFMKRLSSFDWSDSYYDDMGAITYSDMPKSQSNRNNQEFLMVKRYERVTKNHMEIHKVVYEIDCVIESLPNVYARILHLSYCSKEKYSMNEIAAKIKGYRVNEYGEREEFHYSVKNIEKLKSEALLFFAEAFKSRNLIAYKK